MRCSCKQFCITMALLLMPLYNVAIGADPAQEQLHSLLTKAKEALTRTEADDLFNQAENLLQKQLRLNTRDRSFKRNHIARERAQKYLSLWQKNKEDTTLLRDAKKVIKNVISNYDIMQTSYEADAERMEDAGQDSRQMRNAVARVDYELAWTYYRSAVSPEEPERTDYLKKASDSFFRIHCNRYHDDNKFLADCFYGHALCLYHLQKYDDVIENLLVYEVIRPDNTPIEFFKPMTLVRLQCCRKVQNWDMGDRFATQYFSELKRIHGEDYTLDKTDLNIALEWARSLASVQDDTLRVSAQKQLHEIQSIIERYGDPWRVQLAKILGDKGINTQLGQKIKAIEYFDKKDYEKAIIEAESGLHNLPLNDSEPQTLRSDLEYIRLASYCNLNRWSQAHVTAIEFLKDHPQDHRGDDVCKIAVQSGLNALKSTPQIDMADFQNSLKFLEEQFSGISEVQQFRWRAARILSEAKSYLIARNLFESISETNPKYSEAQYDLAEMCFREAKQKVRPDVPNQILDRELLSKASDAFCRFVDSHIQSSQSKSEHPSQSEAIKLGSAICMALLAHDSPNTQQVLILLDQIKTLQGGLSQSLQQALRIQAYVYNDDFNHVQECMNGLAMSNSHVMGITHKTIILLENKHKEVAKRNDENREKSIDTILVKLYQLLLSYINAHPNESVSKQETAIRLHLAHRLVCLSAFDEAIEQYQWLINELSTNDAGSVLRGLAICYEAKEQYDLAQEYWHTLYKGLELGTDEWLEATYYFILNYIKKGDTETAGKRLRYFRIETENMDLGRWGQKFEDLEQKLNMNPSNKS